MDQIHFDMEEKMLTLEQEAKITEKALKIKDEKKLRKDYPMVVYGETKCGETAYYVAFMATAPFHPLTPSPAAPNHD